MVFLPLPCFQLRLEILFEPHFDWKKVKNEYLHFAGNKDNLNSYCRQGSVGSPFLFNRCSLKLLYSMPSVDVQNRDLHGFLSTFITVSIILSTGVL